MATGSEMKNENAFWLIDGMKKGDLPEIALSFNERKLKNVESFIFSCEQLSFCESLQLFS